MISGQLVNYHKSGFAFSRNTSNAQKQLNMGVFNIPLRDSLG